MGGEKRDWNDHLVYVISLWLCILPFIKYLPTSSIDHTIFANWSLWNWFCISFVWVWYLHSSSIICTMLCGFKVVVRANLYFSANKSFTNYRVLLTFLLLSIFQPLHENKRKNHWNHPQTKIIEQKKCKKDD
jgi:hypothetical protein